MKWHSKRIAKLAKDDFEKAWLETGKLIPKDIERKAPEKIRTGKSHMIFDTIQKLRGAYLNLGFEEVVNPLFIEDKEIKRQFGPEAAAVLDRCYYLGGLPRPDVGLSDEKVKAIEKFGARVNKESLMDVLHGYKKGEFGGDDLIHNLAEALGVDDFLSVKILDEVFPEFSALGPEASRVTLRSHMTSGWFLTVKDVIKQKPMPIKLFSVDRCFRREQSEDETHLRTYHSASCVFVAEDANIEDAKAVARGLLEPFGFEDFEFRPDEKRSKYYAPDTQTEVYARHKKIGWVEIATFGMYSPVSLSRYDIEYPVMNIGLGVERLAMVLHGFSDIRELAYSQFYADVVMSDEEIASMINVKKSPESKEGREIAKMIAEAGKKYANEKSPCEFSVYSGKLLGSTVSVKLTEKEENKRLLGPAAFNEIFVHGGNIYGLPPGKSNDIRANGIDCHISYLDAIASLAAHHIEQSVIAKEKESVTKVHIARSLNDINLALDAVALRCITANNRLIDIRGPIFITVEAVITQD
ncbi:MAG: O-phosphoserine--tRNA ligase [Candidatus Hydrothermarchaeaceae archaeon]